MGELFEKRKQNLYDAIAFKEPEKVPVGVQMMNWAFHYAGTTYRDVLGDVDKTVEAFTKHLRDFDFDYVHSGISSPIDVYLAIGSQNYVFSSDGVAVEHNETQMKYMSLEDYDLLINDYANFTSKILPKRNAILLNLPFGEAYERFKKAARAALNNAEISARIKEVTTAREFIVPFANSVTPGYMSPFNLIFDRFRGIKNAMADIRRHAELVDDACEVLLQNTLRMNPQFANPKDHYDAYPLARATCHSECFLNTKQFEKYFMKPFKEHYMQFVERGGRYYMRGEGQFKWNIEVMRDLPVGTMTIMLDMDDPFETYPIMKDRMPIATGINSNLLQFGTKEDCVDYLKKCFDAFAPGGGFIVAQNAGLLSSKDAKIENYIATYEAANELSWKK